VCYHFALGVVLAICDFTDPAHPVTVIDQLNTAPMHRPHYNPFSGSYAPNYLPATFAQIEALKVSFTMTSQCLQCYLIVPQLLPLSYIPVTSQLHPCCLLVTSQLHPSYLPVASQLHPSSQLRPSYIPVTSLLHPRRGKGRDGRWIAK
jgi:hypothetical protein